MLFIVAFGFVLSVLWFMLCVFLVFILSSRLCLCFSCFWARPVARAHFCVWARAHFVDWARAHICVWVRAHFRARPVSRAHFCFWARPGGRALCSLFSNLIVWCVLDCLVCVVLYFCVLVLLVWVVCLNVVMVLIVLGYVLLVIILVCFCWFGIGMFGFCFGSLFCFCVLAL